MQSRVPPWRNSWIISGIFCELHGVTDIAGDFKVEIAASIVR